MLFWCARAMIKQLQLCIFDMLFLLFDRSSREHCGAVGNTDPTSQLDDCKKRDGNSLSLLASRRGVGGWQGSRNRQIESMPALC